MTRPPLVTTHTAAVTAHPAREDTTVQPVAVDQPAVDQPVGTGRFPPAATGTPRALRRRWPYLAGGGAVLAAVSAPAAAAAAVAIATSVHLAVGGLPAIGDWAPLAAGMALHPRQAGHWGNAGAGVSRPAAVAALAAAVWSTVLTVIGLIPLGVARGRHRDGAARPRDLTALRAPAIIASAAQTRPVTDLPRWPPTRARRLGLHQYGPRIGVLVDWRRIELRGKHEDSTIAVAPPRGHKTAAVVIPRVLDAPGAVVTTSTKADVLLATSTRRAQLGITWVFDAEGIAEPFAPHWRPLTWDPLEGCQDPDVAIRRASALVGARPMGGVRNGDFFAGAASGVLRCWLMAAALARYSVTELNQWLHNNPHDTTPADVLDSHGSAWGSDLRALAANPGGEMVGGVLGTLQLVLSPLASPRIAAACTRGGGNDSGGFGIADFLASTDTLYLLTEGNPDGAAPFVTALVDEIMHQARRASQLRAGQRLDPPLAMVLDEPANTAAMPNMPTYMSDSGGRGITLTPAPQGFSQMQRRWGADGAKEIWNSATLALIMGGSKETQFLEDLSRLAGEYDRRKVSTTRGGGARSRQHSEHTERVFKVGDLRQIPDGHALMLYQRLPAAVVALPTWWNGSQAKLLHADMDTVRTARTARTAAARPRA